jgi:hypothetical protein
MMLFDIDRTRMLEGCKSRAVERYALEAERDTPLSGMAFVASSALGTVGGVAGFEVLGDSEFDRDLNENRCFGTYFSFSADIISVSCFNC